MQSDDSAGLFVCVCLCALLLLIQKMLYITTRLINSRCALFFVTTQIKMMWICASDDSIYIHQLCERANNKKIFKSFWARPRWISHNIYKKSIGERTDPFPPRILFSHTYLSGRKFTTPTLFITSPSSYEWSTRVDDEKKPPAGEPYFSTAAAAAAAPRWTGCCWFFFWNLFPPSPLHQYIV